MSTKRTPGSHSSMRVSQETGSRCSVSRYSISVPGAHLDRARRDDPERQPVRRDRLQVAGVGEEREHLGGRAGEALLAAQDVMTEHARGTGAAQSSIFRPSSTGCAAFTAARNASSFQPATIDVERAARRLDLPDAVALAVRVGDAVGTELRAAEPLALAVQRAAQRLPERVAVVHDPRLVTGQRGRARPPRA